MINREELERLHEAADREADDANYYGGPPSKHLPHGAAIIAYLRNAVPDILKLMDERDKAEEQRLFFKRQWDQEREYCRNARTERDTLAAENAALTKKVERLEEALEKIRSGRSSVTECSLIARAALKREEG